MTMLAPATHGTDVTDPPDHDRVGTTGLPVPSTSGDTGTMEESRPQSEHAVVTRVRDVGDETVTSRATDTLVVEEPMTIRLDDTLVATTMRTPGHDFELAVGFCHTEGLLGQAPVTGVRYCVDPGVRNHFNVVTIETEGRAPTPTPRLGNVSSSCGWCGSELLDDLCARLEPLTGTAKIGLDVLRRVSSDVAPGQQLFQSTGAAHGAAAFDEHGRIVLIREDVGRHNAVDKVIGCLLLDGLLPAARLGLFVSGRASVEMVQKAWAAGFGTLLAVSAPTALAVRTAERAGITLVGFVRDDGLNVYTELPPTVVHDAPGTSCTSHDGTS
jgi:FdhD protein